MEVVANFARPESQIAWAALSYQLLSMTFPGVAPEDFGGMLVRGACFAQRACLNGVAYEHPSFRPELREVQLLG